MLCNRLRVRSKLVPDRLPRKPYHESVRIMSAAHPHTCLTDGQELLGRHARECPSRVRYQGKLSAGRRRGRRTEMRAEVGFRRKINTEELRPVRALEPSIERLAGELMPWFHCASIYSRFLPELQFDPALTDPIGGCHASL